MDTIAVTTAVVILVPVIAVATALIIVVRNFENSELQAATASRLPTPLVAIAAIATGVACAVATYWAFDTAQSALALVIVGALIFGPPLLLHRLGFPWIAVLFIVVYALSTCAPIMRLGAAS